MDLVGNCNFHYIFRCFDRRVDASCVIHISMTLVWNTIRNQCSYSCRNSTLGDSNKCTWNRHLNHNVCVECWVSKKRFAIRNVSRIRFNCLKKHLSPKYGIMSYFPCGSKTCFLSLYHRRRIYLRLPVSRIYGCARAKFHRNSLHCWCNLIQFLNSFQSTFLFLSSA